MESVSDHEIAAYRDHGAVCLRGLFADQWPELLTAGVEKDKADPGALGAPQHARRQPRRVIRRLLHGAALA